MQIRPLSSLLWQSKPQGKARLVGLSVKCSDFSTLIDSSRSEEVVVKTRSNGHVILDIQHAFNPSPQSPIIISLPSTSTLPSAFNSQAIAAALSSSAPNSTIISINYRWTPAHRFPIPIHDVLAGYDWILEHLVNSENGDRVKRKRKIGVCGELVGGGLASMLALTECHMGRPGISAAVISNAVLDWTFPDEKPTLPTTLEAPGENESDVLQPDASIEKLKRPHQTKSKSVSPWQLTSASAQEMTPSRLLDLRTRFFESRSQYFSPFASPLLFFRTANIAIDTESQVESQELIVEEPGIDPLSPDSAIANGAEERPEALEPPVYERKRKSPRRYPPTGSGLSLPQTRVLAGHASLLREQNFELAARMRRSVLLSARRMEKGLSDYDVDENEGATFDKSAENAANDRIQFAELDGEGIWREEAIRSAAAWLERALTRDRPKV